MRQPPRFDQAVAGLNSNVRSGGKTYHVQTEDSGRSYAHVITHVFLDGNIVATRKGSYRELLGAGDLAALVARMMRAQHRAMSEMAAAGLAGAQAAGAPVPVPPPAAAAEEMRQGGEEREEAPVPPRRPTKIVIKESPPRRRETPQGKRISVVYRVIADKDGAPRYDVVGQGGAKAEAAPRDDGFPDVELLPPDPVAALPDAGDPDVEIDTALEEAPRVPPPPSPAREKSLEEIIAEYMSEKV